MNTLVYFVLELKESANIFPFSSSVKLEFLQTNGAFRLIG